MASGAGRQKARVHLVVAVRPNIVKIAPLWHALATAEDFAPALIDAGQHYDRAMSGAIWEELGLPKPDHRLEAGSGTHAEQIGRAMVAYESLAKAHRPDWLIVPGDVNASLGCAIAGARLGIPLVHLEAGLRSGDRTMPEEQNRILIDAVADVLWTPSPDADVNLARERHRRGPDRTGGQHHDRQPRARASGDRLFGERGAAWSHATQLRCRYVSPAVQCRR